MYQGIRAIKEGNYTEGLFAYFGAGGRIPILPSGLNMQLGAIAKFVKQYINPASIALFANDLTDGSGRKIRGVDRFTSALSQFGDAGNNLAQVYRIAAGITGNQNIFGGKKLTDEQRVSLIGSAIAPYLGKAIGNLPTQGLGAFKNATTDFINSNFLTQSAARAYNMGSRWVTDITKLVLENLKPNTTNTVEDQLKQLLTDMEKKIMNGKKINEDEIQRFDKLVSEWIKQNPELMKKAFEDFQVSQMRFDILLNGFSENWTPLTGGLGVIKEKGLVGSKEYAQTKEAIEFIKTYFPEHAKQLEGTIIIINPITRLTGREGGLNPLLFGIKLMDIDNSVFEDTQRVVGIIVHELTHAVLESKGINDRNTSRDIQEEICRKWESLAKGLYQSKPEIRIKYNLPQEVTTAPISDNLLDYIPIHK